MSEWEPIDTAPKDGRMALVYRPLAHLSGDEPIAVKRLIGGRHFCWEATIPTGQKPTNPTDGACHVTHWMPIPAPPDGTIWRPIPGFPRYEANTKGHVRRSALPDGTRIFHALKPYQCRKTGYLKVSVYRDGKQHRRGVHQLVCLAFHGEPPEGKPFACHENGDPGDCRPDNLYWGSRAENTADKIRHAKQRGVDGTWTLTKVEARPQ